MPETNQTELKNAIPFTSKNADFNNKSEALEYLSSTQSKCKRCSKIWYRNDYFGYHATTETCRMICEEGNFNWERVENIYIKNYGACPVAYLLKFRKSCPCYKNKVQVKVVGCFQYALKKTLEGVKYFLEWFSSLK